MPCGPEQENWSLTLPARQKRSGAAAHRRQRLAAAGEGMLHQIDRELRVRNACRLQSAGQSRLRTGVGVGVHLQNVWFAAAHPEIDAGIIAATEQAKSLPGQCLQLAT